MGHENLNPFSPKQAIEPKNITLTFPYLSVYQLARKTVSDLPTDRKALISEVVLSHTWEEGMPHREAKKNPTGRACGVFPVPPLSLDHTVLSNHISIWLFIFHAS